MKIITDFKKYVLNELKASTYLSAADSMKEFSPEKTKKLIKHAADMFTKQAELDKSDEYYITTEYKQYVTNRDLNKIHPLLIEIEEYNNKKHSNNYTFFVEGAGMDKKSINIKSSKNNINYIGFSSPSVVCCRLVQRKLFIQGSGALSRYDIPKNILESLVYVNITNKIERTYFLKLPRKLAKRLHESSFVVNGDNTWRHYWDGKN